MLILWDRWLVFMCLFTSHILQFGVCICLILNESHWVFLVLSQCLSFHLLISSEQDPLMLFCDLQSICFVSPLICCFKRNMSSVQVLSLRWFCSRNKRSFFIQVILAHTVLWLSLCQAAISGGLALRRWQARSRTNAVTSRERDALVMRGNDGAAH